MAYDEDLAARLRDLLAGEPGLAEKRMFGGLAFLVEGHMAVSASGRGGLLLRCDPEDTDLWVHEPGVSRFAMRGREMDGWLHVDASVVGTEAELSRWTAIGLAYVRSLPPK
jgi:hypothetical protein